MKKKVLSFLVVICMIIGMLPVIAMAAGQTNAVMEFATGVDTKDNSVLVPDEAAYFKVTAPDPNGNTYLTKTGASEGDYDVAYIYEDVPTLYLNGANIQNDLPFVLYAWDADTRAKVETDLKVVIQDDTVIHSTCTKGEDNGDDPWNGYGAAISMHPMGGTATITSVGDAKLTASAVTVESYSGPDAHKTSGVRGSVILVGHGDLTLDGANIDIDFSKTPINASTAPSGIGVCGGDMTINGGNLRVGLGLRAEGQEMNSTLQLEAKAFEGYEAAGNGSLTIMGGANVLLMQDNGARAIRYDGALTISDSSVEIASTAATGRPAFHSAQPVFNYTKDYTAVAAVNTVGEETKLPTIVNDVPVAPDNTAEIALEDISGDDQSETYYKKYNYFKITVAADEEPVQLPSFAGTYMTLGVVNDVNFLIAKSDLEGLDIDGLTAHFVMERHEGKTDRVATVKLEEDPDYEDYYRAKFHDVAAAELCDEITVVLKDSEGNAVTEAFTITMGRAIQKLYEASTGEANAKWRDLCVALLNYGAAAQIAFNYNVTDLATKYLPDC